MGWRCVHAHADGMSAVIRQIVGPNRSESALIRPLVMRTQLIPLPSVCVIYKHYCVCSGLVALWRSEGESATVLKADAANLTPAAEHHVANHRPGLVWCRRWRYRQLRLGYYFGDCGS
jgi:hypothetical protein